MKSVRRHGRSTRELDDEIVWLLRAGAWNAFPTGQIKRKRGRMRKEKRRAGNKQADLNFVAEKQSAWWLGARVREGRMLSCVLTNRPCIRY